jgi:short-subunit dehydrogenase
MANILITGASSGLGAALARAYAAPESNLSLWGRNVERLSCVAAACRLAGAGVATVAMDLGDLDSLIPRLGETDREWPIDLAICNAGLGGAPLPDRAVESPERARDVAVVNFAAAIVVATTIAERMVARGRGHIVLIGSIAESFPLPMAPTYAAAKAGLKMFAEALGIRLRGFGVKVTLVSPGFIDTPMSRQVNSAKPRMMSADGAAALIKKKLARGATKVVFPRCLAIARAAFLWLPPPLRRAVMGRIKA